MLAHFRARRAPRTAPVAHRAAAWAAGHLGQRHAAGRRQDRAARGVRRCGPGRSPCRESYSASCARRARSPRAGRGAHHRWSHRSAGRRMPCRAPRHFPQRPRAARAAASAGVARGVWQRRARRPIRCELARRRGAPSCSRGGEAKHYRAPRPRRAPAPAGRPPRRPRDPPATAAAPRAGLPVRWRGEAAGNEQAVGGQGCARWPAVAPAIVTDCTRSRPPTPVTTDCCEHLDARARVRARPRA